MKFIVSSRKAIVSGLVVMLGVIAPGGAHAAWQYLVNGSEFANTSVFTSYYGYNYSWGQDQNGSARMWASNVIVSNGTVTLRCSYTNGYPVESPPYSTDDTNITIRFNSGTFYLYNHVEVSPTEPTWAVSLQAIVPTATGTWPAFWMTGSDTWPPESDFMEFKGSTTCWQNTYDGTWTSAETTTSTASTAWHTYRMTANLLNSTQVDFHYYIDGSLKGSTQTDTTFNSAPCTLMVDYQMDGSSGTYSGSGNPQLYVVSNLTVYYENVTGVGVGAVANGAYKLTMRSGSATTNCLDVGNNYTTNGSPLDQWPYNAGMNQQWLVTFLGGGLYSIIGRESGRALEVKNAATTNGAAVDIADYTGASNQKWRFVSAGSGYYYCLNGASGLALEVARNASTNLAPIDQWSLAGNDLPVFVTPSPNPSGTAVIFNASVGIPGQAYTLLSTPDPSQPMATWATTATATTDASGNLSYTNLITPGSPQQFFALKLGPTGGYNQQWQLQSP